MIGLRVTCITKPNRSSSYEFYTDAGGQRAVVTVVDVPGRASYIRKKPDSTGKDNLLALPECAG